MQGIELDKLDKNIEFEFVAWKYATEVEDLQNIDIGTMPLNEDVWSRGKCGLKALQYMAAGIPAVCSPVGMNSEIIQDGRNGFLASGEEDWFNKLSLLIEDRGLRQKIGEAGRQTVEEKYSLKINAPKLKQAIFSCLG